MKTILALLISMISVNAFAVNLICSAQKITLDETTLKVTLTPNSEREVPETIAIGHAEVFKRLTSRSRETYQEFYTLPGRQKIIKVDSRNYTYSRTNAEGAEVESNVRCQVVQ